MALLNPPAGAAVTRCRSRRSGRLTPTRPGWPSSSRRSGCRPTDAHSSRLNWSNGGRRVHGPRQSVSALERAARRASRRNRRRRAGSCGDQPVRRGRAGRGARPWRVPGTRPGTLGRRRRALHPTDGPGRANVPPDPGAGRLRVHRRDANPTYTTSEPLRADRRSGAPCDHGKQEPLRPVTNASRLPLSACDQPPIDRPSLVAATPAINNAATEDAAGRWLLVADCNHDTGVGPRSSFWCGAATTSPWLL